MWKSPNISLEERSNTPLLESNEEITDTDVGHRYL